MNAPRRSPVPRSHEATELRHVIRAACDAIGDDQVLVMGSQAILAAWKEAVVPERLSLSSEADIAAFFDPEELKADEIMGVLGQDSLFHQTHGFYADGLLSDGPRLPDGWPDRLLPLTSKTAATTYVGWCLEPHDLCASKMAAGRDKDHEFVRSTVEARLVDPSELAERITTTPMRDEVRSTALGLIGRWAPTWDEKRRTQFRRARAQARTDLLRQSPHKAPPLVRPPIRCSEPTSAGPCRALQSNCPVHGDPQSR